MTPRLHEGRINWITVVRKPIVISLVRELVCSYENMCYFVDNSAGSATPSEDGKMQASVTAFDMTSPLVSAKFCAVQLQTHDELAVQYARRINYVHWGTLAVKLTPNISMRTIEVRTVLYTSFFFHKGFRTHMSNNLF